MTYSRFRGLVPMPLTCCCPPLNRWWFFLVSTLPFRVERSRCISPPPPFICVLSYFFFLHQRSHSKYISFASCFYLSFFFLWLECLMARVCHHLCNQPWRGVGGRCWVFLIFYCYKSMNKLYVGFACGGVACKGIHHVFSSSTCLIWFSVFSRLTHLKFILVYAVGFASTFIIFQMAVSSLNITY